MSTTTFVIFGASGDLAARKVLPALYWLTAAGKLPSGFSIVAVARSEMTPKSLVDKMVEHLEEPESQVLEQMTDMITIARMDSKDAAAYEPLLDALKNREADADDVTRLLHISIPPWVAMPVLEALKRNELIDAPNITTRVLLEKPFGFDLESARELEGKLADLVTGDQLYRIDHYLGKKDVQTLLGKHLNGGEMADQWSNQHIERIEIEASEDMGIEGRADFYEQTGALRDVVQSHLLSLLALTLMATPQDEGAEAFCHERAQVLESISPIAADAVSEQTYRGQYQGYRREVDNDESTTETYAVLKLHSGNPQWSGVPLVVMGGKGVDAARAEIRVHLKDTDRPLVIPIESASKADITRPADGYERVILDAINGDRTNTRSGAEVLASWEILDPVLTAWQRDGEGLVIYPFGERPPTL